ncbi:MAG: ABC transporter substrate-binding protein [Acidimicrobiales bacterium]
MRQRLRILRGLVCGVAVVGLVSLAAVAVAPTTSGATTKTTVTVPVGTWGQVAVNYIFPFMTTTYFSVANIDTFEYYMFRPLYMFGSPNKITVDQRLSLAKTPALSNGDKTVKITLKNYKWSDGEKVTATDIRFWMNIWHQKPDGFAGWFPGGLSLPTSVKSLTVTNPSTVTFEMKTPVNEHWFLYNELSEITPLPLAWTKTSTTGAAGSAGCAKATFATTGKGGANYAKCKAVYTFLSEQSGFNPTNPKATLNALPTYATNPLWKVVDGPWTLQSFTPTVGLTLVPNPKYSGPNKPKVTKYVEKQYTSASAQYDAMVGGTLDAGLLPPTEITAGAAKPGKPGVAPTPGPNNPRLTSTYNLVPAPSWSIDYYWINFNSTGDTGNAGPIFRQLYIRQAYQHLVNQTLIISHLEHGYAVPNYGPVPVLPKSPLVSTTELKNPYPYSVAKAKALLKAHGWQVVPGGVDTCKKPGTGASDCGKGIKKGAKLNFTMVELAGTKTATAIVVTQKDSLSAAGIRVNLSSASFTTIIGDIAPCPKGCKWEIDDYSQGLAWLYEPDLYPNGTEILLAGAASNDGNFATRTATTLIKKTITSTTTIFKVEDYLAKTLPVIWQPLRITLREVRKGLNGLSPWDPMDTGTPATFHWS